MLATYLQRGEALDYKNATEAVIPAGAVIDLKTRIAVAGDDILPGQTGAAHVAGVFAIPKAGGKEIAQGAALYFDTAESNLTTDAGEGKTPAGYAAAAAEAEAAVALVSIGTPIPAPAAASAPAEAKNPFTEAQESVLLKGTGSNTEKTYKVTVNAEGTGLDVAENS